MPAVSLVAMRCRSATGDPDTAGGLERLGAAFGHRLQASPRAIGSAAAAVPADPREDLDTSRGCLLEAGGQVEDALDAGVRPVLLAGDGAVALATLPAVVRRRPDARLLWLDAHPCFHVLSDTPGPPLERTALAGACGRWPSGFAGNVAADALVLCGTRAIDDDERERLASPRVRVIGTTLETLVHLQHALDGAATYVHLDVDVLDEEVMPVAQPVRGGLPAEKLLDLLDAVADSCEVIGVEVCGFACAGDDDRDEALADVVVSALDPLLP